MTIVEMLGVWSERTSTIAKDGAARLDFQGVAVGFNTASGGSWETPLEDWEEELNGNIKATMDVLIYGREKDKGILSPGEVYAVEYHHLPNVPNVFVSNRRVFILDEYNNALVKLKPAMIKRNFLVD